MTFDFRCLSLFLLLPGIALSPPGRAQPPAAQSPTNAPSVTPAPSATSAPIIAPSPTEQVNQELREAFELANKGQYDAAVVKVNSALQIDPKNAPGISLRGTIYTEQKRWDAAEKDFLAILQIDPANTPAKFNLAEIKFRQKQYDVARPGFLALKKDEDFGDLASYKVFLCDLFGGHEDVASKELDAFNQVGSNASYYFANAAWDLVHKKTDDAQGWLGSALRIYPPQKLNLYASSLKDLGYLHPVPPASLPSPGQ